MSEAVVDDIVAVLPPLLQSLEALGFIERHLNPPAFDQVMKAAGTPDQALQAVRPRLADWPEEFAHLRTPLATASDAAITAFEGLRAVQHGDGDLIAVFRALRLAPRALEALYPLAAKLPPVSEFFVDPALREDAGLLSRLAEPARDNTGIVHDHNEPGSRGGFSLYVPEYYTPDRAWPLVMALHGGSGNGRGFLWSWLRDARSHGAILVAPTATGNTSNKTTWALMGEDTDSPIHPSGAGGRHLPSADGGDGRCPEIAGTAHPYRAWPARLDVSGAGGAEGARGADSRRRRRHLP